MKENLMPHNAHPTRRTILTGGAGWPERARERHGGGSLQVSGSVD